MHGTIPPSEPDVEAAVDFLERLRPGGPWVVTAIVPDGKTLTNTFAANEGEALRSLIRSRNIEGRNIYYTANPVRKATMKKPSKEDIIAGEFLHVDADPDEGESSEAFKVRFIPILKALAPTATAIVDSGNGFQILYRLTEPVQDVRALESANRALLELLGAPKGTHNIDRLLRLPGTINWPNKKKLKAGRTACLSSLVEFNTISYTLSDFPAPLEKQTEKQTRRSNTTKMPRGLVTMLHVSGAGPYQSRSELFFAFIANALRAELDKNTIIVACLDAIYSGKGIHEHVAENGGEAYVRRQIAKVLNKLSEETIFDRDKNNRIICRSQKNISTALISLGVTLRYNSFDGRMIIKGLPGFDLLDDAAMERLWLSIDERFEFLPPKDFFWVVVGDAARQNSFHPVRDYLDGLKWDGVDRIDRWLTTYAGAVDTEYVRAIGRLVLIAAVRRIRSPGCKFDEMPILEGTQGTEKSKALEILAVNPDWFSDDLPLGADSKRMIEHISGRWIIEAAELNGMRKADVEHLKAFLSRRTDRARLAYGRMTTELLRQCVIFGSTNDHKYLRDLTGNRRFWPVKVIAFDTAALRRDRDQLWAEAAELEARDESIRLDPKFWEAAAAEQAERTIDEPWIDQIAGVLGDMEGKLLASDAWTVIGLPAGQRMQEHNARFGRAMRALGWERKKLRLEGKVQHVYVRGDAKATALKRIVVTRSSPHVVSACYEDAPF
ncbi:virulence-associated E family protein [Bradyrhizobium sp. 172]|uniref:virulence-associated E family protein n=1 Tax=Bradyrhizobium sp. 172 TaxID=2782643 RepID=UPI001FFE3E2A|nr:virulence-associated E family protein [Bradyrhizobium sp. 172]UPJ97430.1 hypothetical protein IVB07_07825 [Bradyrhizobium sp. 172]